MVRKIKLLPPLSFKHQVYLLCNRKLTNTAWSDSSGISRNFSSLTETKTGIYNTWKKWQNQALWSSNVISSASCFPVKFTCIIHPFLLSSPVHYTFGYADIACPTSGSWEFKSVADLGEMLKRKGMNRKMSTTAAGLGRHCFLIEKQSKLNAQ